MSLHPPSNYKGPIPPVFNHMELDFMTDCVATRLRDYEQLIKSGEHQNDKLISDSLIAGRNFCQSVHDRLQAWSDHKEEEEKNG
jgi:hypothetical protein